MLSFRIAPARFVDLSGKGGLYASARWHTRGRPIVYSAGTRALSILEVLVHTDPDDIPEDLQLLTFEIPDDLPIRGITRDQLPADWQLPLHSGCQSLGDQWLIASESPILRAPSALVPEELNLLINPLHPGAARIRIVEQRSFEFDERLLAPVRR
jgi:RES domain-containing protein